jgi:hypothetical protein
MRDDCPLTSAPVSIVDPILPLKIVLCNSF